MALLLATSLLLSVPPNYDPSDTYTFYKLASAAYCNTTGWLCAPCVASNQSVLSFADFYDNGTDTRAFVAAYWDKVTHHHNVVVAIRGTESIMNWIENLHFAKTDKEMSCAGCMVHSGFYDVWKAHEAEVLAEVLRLQRAYPGVKLYVTGHSMGGAAALIGAYVLQYDHNQTISGVYTMGCPRVGNAAFANFYMQESKTHVTWRLTHHRDIVPHLPLESMGFHHTSTEVFYTEDSSSYIVCDGSGEDPHGMDSLYGDSVYDHLHYLKETIGSNVCGASGPYPHSWDPWSKDRVGSSATALSSGLREAMWAEASAKAKATVSRQLRRR